jgi:threonine synthase
MNFYSTNNLIQRANLETAILQGLAPDGGLYYPSIIPQFSQKELQDLKNQNLKYIAYQTISKWFGEDITKEDIDTIVRSASDFDIPLIKVGDQDVMELFHGPTMAFKDVAAKYLAQFMSHYLSQKGKSINLLVATSGDTGGAIAQGFANVSGVNVYILFPKGKVSALQEEQLTRVADNVTSIELPAVFDDCQAMVKQAFNDPDLQYLNLTSANSISVGRIIPQIIYYIYAYAQLAKDEIEFTIPSGNFGNITAALFAKKMGIPITKLHAATNANDAVVNYFNSGKYNPLETKATLSNAMDVGNPSNFARILHYFDNDHKKFLEVIDAKSISDKETIETITKVYAKYKYLLDPHTAVAWNYAEQINHNNNVIVSTASPIKFSSEIYRTTGIEIDDSLEISKLQAVPKRKTVLNNSYKEFKDFLINTNKHL